MDRHGDRSGTWGLAVQTTGPRDLGALALVIGLFMILLIVSVMLGSPAT